MYQQSRLLKEEDLGDTQKWSAGPQQVNRMLTTLFILFFLQTCIKCSKMQLIITVTKRMN